MRKHSLAGFLAVGMAVLAVAGIGLSNAKEPIKSGLQVGETAPAFHVQDVTGPSKGQSLCYR